MQVSVSCLFPLVVVLLPFTEPSVRAGCSLGARNERASPGAAGQQGTTALEQRRTVVVTSSVNCPANARQVPRVRQVWGRARRSACGSGSRSGSVGTWQGTGMAVTPLRCGSGSASGCKPQLKTRSWARRQIPRWGILADLFRGSLRYDFLAELLPTALFKARHLHHYLSWP